MEELINFLGQSLIDEDEDVQKYENMAEKFKEHGHDGYAQILMDISAEEAIHARHLRGMLADIAK